VALSVLLERHKPCQLWALEQQASRQVCSNNNDGRAVQLAKYLLVRTGSVAAIVQSSLYGAVVPAGGWFAAATSWGATGAMAVPLAVAAVPVGIGATLARRHSSRR